MAKRKPPPRPPSPAIESPPPNADSAAGSSLKKQKVDDDFVDEIGQRDAKVTPSSSGKPPPKRKRQAKNEPGEAESEPANESGGGGQQKLRSSRTRAVRKPAAQQSSPAPVKTESEADDSSDFVEEPVQKPPPPRGNPKAKGKRRGKTRQSDDIAEEEEDGAFVDEEPVNDGTGSKQKVLLEIEEKPDLSEVKAAEEDADCSLDDPIPEDEARRKWPHRFSMNPKSDGDDELMKAKCHYKKATVDGITYKLGDHAHVQSEEEKESYICKITELFEGMDSVLYFRPRWYYRPVDTVISGRFEEWVNPDGKRVFFSHMEDDNNLYCLVKPVKIVRLPVNVDATQKESIIKDFDYYFDRLYLLPHCTFKNLGPDDSVDSELAASSSGPTTRYDPEATEMTMLDLYSGCGGMSTGLSMGSNTNGAKLVTKWALDLNKHACDSLKLNHPQTLVRNEAADNFLILLRQWHMICASYGLVEGSPHPEFPINDVEGDSDECEDVEDEDNPETYEVEEIVDICYGSPNNKKDPNLQLHFKIKWKGFGRDEDSWEPTDCIRGCPEKVKEFVRKSFDEKLLPLPGTVDVICGGPPCQGISGLNRYRDSENPLRDDKNKQIIVYMDIVEFLKPRFVLMENVVDLFKFAGAHLGRYAFARLINMQYQARVGFMAAGAYGLAQFRMRAFVWAALPSEILPLFPLPTHDVVVRGNVPREFDECFVAYEEGRKPELEGKLFLQEVIDDLPAIENDEARDVMPYARLAETTFQKMIRLRKDEMPGFLNTSSGPIHHDLFDHRPLNLNEDDYARVLKIPKEKGACFRDLPGVIVIDNKARLDPAVDRELLPSRKPLVPNYALSYVRGTSTKPFGRLWWDETVSTVVTRAEPHNQAILHPLQDRVLSIRENARLQGFPDFYRLCGTVKERYIQVGNAVAVPVARALGHSLASAARGQSSGEDAVFVLPADFRI